MSRIKFTNSNIKPTTNHLFSERLSGYQLQASKQKKRRKKEKMGGGACNSQEIFKKKGNYFNKTKELKLLSQYLYHQHSNQGEYTLIASRL